MRSTYTNRDERYADNGYNMQTNNSVKSPSLLFYHPEQKSRNGINGQKSLSPRKLGSCENRLNMVNSQGNSSNLKGQSKKSSGRQNYPFPERQHEIEIFIQSLSEAREEISANSEQVRETLMGSQQFYGQQIQQINEYFQTIVQSLELEKNKCYNYILVQREKAEKETRYIFNSLAEGEKEIVSMISDIEENLQSVYSINWHNYQLVMDAFNSRFSEIEILLAQIREKGIADVEYRKIQFAGVPESINSLSDVIMQGSYGEEALTSNPDYSNYQSQEKSNCTDHTIFSKLKQGSIDMDVPSSEKANHMVFSFESQCLQNQSKQSEENLFDWDSKDSGIKLKKDKQKNYSCVERIDGIKEVEELDVIQIDEDLMEISDRFVFPR